jgi:two-component sensor histidine kinase
VEINLASDRTPAFARAVAHRLNDELTLILSSLNAELTAEDKLEAVEKSARRCAALTTTLLRYAEKNGDVRHPMTLDSLLERGAA